jgi:hypothetical protein
MRGANERRIDGISKSTAAEDAREITRMTLAVLKSQPRTRQADLRTSAAV